MTHEKFMRKVLKEADKSLAKGEYPAGCIIVRNGKIIVKAQSGINRDAAKHAEINAIDKANKKLNKRFLDDCILYTNVEPCLMCAQAILYAKIKKVIYGADHGEYGSKKTFEILKENGLGTDVEVINGVMKGESVELLNRFKELAKKIY